MPPLFISSKSFRLGMHSTFNLARVITLFIQVIFSYAVICQVGGLLEILINFLNYLI